MKCCRSRERAWMAAYGMAMASAMACPGQLWADDMAMPAAPAAPATAPAEAPATAPAPRAPLMQCFDAIGWGQEMDKLNLNIYGYAEAGFMYDTSPTSGNGGSTLMGYDGVSNRGDLNQIDLTVERTVDPTKKEFDIGFRAEAIWGQDAAFIHSNGLATGQDGIDQFDPLQMYVDIAMPGAPLRLRLGKWIELAGFEQFSANIYNAFGDPSKSFYSHSYQFLYAEPGTQSGAMLTWVASPAWTFDLAVTDGWNQSTRDSNGSADIVGRVTWTPADTGTTLIFNFTEGPEFSPAAGQAVPPNSGDHGDWWTYLDLVLAQKIGDNLMLGLGIDYVDAPHLPGNQGAQQWGGITGYASYVIGPHLTLNGRSEWYRDDSQGFSVSGLTGGPTVATNVYSNTIGLAIKPLPDSKVLSGLLLRPELRYDYADQKVFGGGEHGQLVFSVDVLFQF
jgi:hypothetical protein